MPANCVIVSFANCDGDKKFFAKNIKGYLQDIPNGYIEKRKNPIDDSTSKISDSNIPADGGNLILFVEKCDELLKKFHQTSECRQYISIGFLNKNFIAVNASLVVTDASLYLLAILGTCPFIWRGSEPLQGV